VDRIETASEKAAAMATAAKSALDEHMTQSALLMADGDRREKRIWDALDSRKALDNLTEALPIVARSTPHEEES
jgi:transketolase N-terminal domain/subunit